MPDPLKIFEEKIAIVKHIPPPEVHVADAVMQRVHEIRAFAHRTWAWMALSSCAAAAVVAIFAFWLSPENYDPLDAIFQIVTPFGL